MEEGYDILMESLSDAIVARLLQSRGMMGL